MRRSLTRSDCRQARSLAVSLWSLRKRFMRLRVPDNQIALPLREAPQNAILAVDLKLVMQAKASFLRRRAWTSKSSKNEHATALACSRVLCLIVACVLTKLDMSSQKCVHDIV